MRIRRGLLGAYRLLLQLYPPAFRRRFAPEMLELAAAADPSEWPLILSDTTTAIFRCWLEGTPVAPVPLPPDAYVPVGGFPLSAARLLQGFVVSLALVAGFCGAARYGTPSSSCSASASVHDGRSAASASAHSGTCPRLLLSRAAVHGPSGRHPSAP